MEAQGRFQPVEINKWLGEHSINVPDMHELDDTGAGAGMKHWFFRVLPDHGMGEAAHLWSRGFPGSQPRSVGMPEAQPHID